MPHPRDPLSGDPRWRTETWYEPRDGDPARAVQLSRCAHGVMLRSAGRPDEAMWFGAESFRAFCDAVKRGDFDRVFTPRPVRGRLLYKLISRIRGRADRLPGTGKNHPS